MAKARPGLQPEAEGGGAEGVQGEEVHAPGPAAEEDARHPAGAEGGAEDREDGQGEDAGAFACLLVQGGHL